MTGHDEVVGPRDEEVGITVGLVVLEGHLRVPAAPIGVVLFAHGSGSSRHSPRNRAVAHFLNEGGFAPLLGDDRAGPAEQVRRVVLSSGKLHYDLARGREELHAHEVALWRLEQFYPFPRLALTALLAAHPQVKELVWAQEEHLNQGAWSGIRDELTQACRARGIRVRCVSRVANAGHGDVLWKPGGDRG